MKWQAALAGKKFEMPQENTETDLTPEQLKDMDAAIEAAKIRKRLELESRKHG